MRHVVAYARISTQVKLDCSMQHASHANKFHAHAAINSHAVCWQKYGYCLVCHVGEVLSNQVESMRHEYS